MLDTEALAQVVTRRTCTAIAAIKRGLRTVKGLESEKVQFPVTAVAGCHGDLLFYASRFLITNISRCLRRFQTFSEES